MPRCHSYLCHLIPPLAALGAAYGTAKSGTGIAAMSVMRPDLIMKSVIPVVMAGIIAIYGLVVSVLIANKCEYMYVYVYVCEYVCMSMCVFNLWARPLGKKPMLTIE